MFDLRGTKVQEEVAQANGAEQDFSQQMAHPQGRQPIPEPAMSRCAVSAEPSSPRSGC